MTSRRNILALTILATALWAGQATAQPKPIVIGFPAAMTGPSSAFDAVALTAAKLAVEHINAAGGVLGRKFELRVLDYASAPATAVTLGNQLINQNVDVLFGGSGSAANSALLPIVARAKVPFLTVSALTGDTTWAFSAQPPFENSFAKAEMGLFADVVKGDSIAIMAFPAPFGQGNAKEATRIATAKGIKVVETINVDPFVTDLSSEMLRVKESGAKAILSFAGGPSYIVMAKNAASVGLNIPIIYAIDSKERLMQATQLYANTYASGLAYFAYPNMSDAQAKAACDKLIPELMKVNPEHVYSIAGYAYDYLQLLAAAIKSSGATTGDKLRNEIENMSYVGCANKYKFSASDHTGQASGPNPFVVGQWSREGIFKTIWRDK